MSKQARPAAKQGKYESVLPAIEICIALGSTHISAFIPQFKIEVKK
jgi:hypothetical protein